MTTYNVIVEGAASGSIMVFNTELEANKAQENLDKIGYSSRIDVDFNGAPAQEFSKFFS